MENMKADFTVDHKWFESMQNAEVLRLTDGKEFIRKDVATKIMASYVEKELASLRQQLKEREESIKELLTIAERYEPIKEYQEDEEIISRAKAILDKK